MKQTSDSGKGRRYFRKVCRTVLMGCNQIRSSVGSTPPVDISDTINLTSSPKNLNDDSRFTLINYTIDVEHAAESVLKPFELVIFREQMLDKATWPKKQDVQFMNICEKLGKVFIKWKLFPTQGYLES